MFRGTHNLDGTIDLLMAEFGLGKAKQASHILTLRGASECVCMCVLVFWVGGWGTEEWQPWTAMCIPRG